MELGSNHWGSCYLCLRSNRSEGDMGNFSHQERAAILVNTAYAPRSGVAVQRDGGYLVLYFSEGVKIPFVVEHHATVNDVANAAEEHTISQRKAGKKHRYFFTRAENVLEIIPFPKEFK